MVGSGPFVTDTSNIDGSYTQLRTPWAIECPNHGLVHMTHREYMRQLRNPDAFWSCACGYGTWSDDEYEAALETLANEEDAI